MRRNKQALWKTLEKREKLSMVSRLDLARREARAEQRERKRERVREDREWRQKKRQEREHAPNRRAVRSLRGWGRRLDRFRVVQEAEELGTAGMPASVGSEVCTRDCGISIGTTDSHLSPMPGQRKMAPLVEGNLLHKSRGMLAFV